MIAVCIYAVFKYLLPVLFPFLEDGFAWIEGLFILANPSEIEFLEGSFENILTALSSGIVSLSNAALSAGAGAATKIPGVFMRTVVTVIATVFLTIDFDKVSGFLLRQIPEKQKVIMQEAKGYFGGTLLKCIAFYGLIFLITFLELWAGLAMLFFTYSFLAWLAETAVATVKVRNFGNRGFASGSFCFLYGFTGLILTIFLQALKGDVAVHLSVKHGGGYCRGVVCRENTGKDEAEKVVGLF